MTGPVVMSSVSTVGSWIAPVNPPGSVTGMSAAAAGYVRAVLYGREREWARLLDLVAQAQRGSAATVVVRGEPGVGKSTLLDALADELGDASVLRTQGFETETPLAYAALHGLLRPLARLRAVLPEPQARALRVAFGEEDGPVVEPFLMGVATLSLLTAAAEEHLVVCLVEDAHWLDPASADALVFAARRLGADRVVLVFAVREGAAREFRPDGLDELSLRGLEPTAALALLRHQVGDLLSEEVAAQLVSQTGGNPLALVELSEELTPDQRRGVAPVPADLLITGRVERVFLDRCRRLPPPVQSVLLLAAADDTGRLSTVKDAAATLGLEPEAVVAALDSRLLVADGETVRVRHPLVRSAVYQSASDEERRRVHRALAEALPGDPDRQAWHRAGAAEGPDEGVVEALVGAGSRAERRGGYVAALAAYERAASLTARDASRAECLWGAARNAWACGRPVQARTHLAGAAAFATDPVLRADLARLRARIEVYVGSATDAHRIFVEGAHAAHEADPHRALEMAVAAAVLRTYGADSGATLPAGDVLAERSADDTPRTACLKQLLPSMTRAAEGDWAGAVAALDPALAGGDLVDDLDVLGNLGNAALQLGDDEAQRRFYGLMLSRARDNGAVMVVIYALQRRAFSLLVGGDWADLRSSAEEGAVAEPERGPAGPHRFVPRLADPARRPAGPPRLRRPPRRARRGRRRPVAGDPDRPRPRPHQVGPGDPCGRRRRRLRRPAPPGPPPPVHPVPPRGGRPHRRRRTRRRATARPRLDRRAGALRERHRATLGARLGPLRRGDDRRPGGGRRVVPAGVGTAGVGSSGPARGGPTTRPARDWRTASGYAATNGASTRVSICGRHSRPSGTSGRQRWPTGRPRS